MRESFEALENNHLASYASKSHLSKGRQYPEPLSKTRTCFQRDRDRIIHTKAFRRLKHKTQVFIVTISDHYRSRLTHTIEVAQLSRHLARLLNVNEDLAETIALAHDLGHTPFGHSGEDTLNNLLRKEGGFEHNQQSLRIVDTLETKYPTFPGLNLSFEVRAGLMKHQTPWDHPKYNQNTSSLEAQITNITDEIAYNNHDLDDGLCSKLLIEPELESHLSLWKEAKKNIKNAYTNLQEHELRHLINSDIISTQLLNAYHNTLNNIKKNGISNIADISNATTPLISFDSVMAEKNKQLRLYLSEFLYKHPNIQRMNQKGQYMIKALFKYFQKTPKKLPPSFLNKTTSTNLSRIIADYIAGMTDTYATQLFQTLSL